MKNIKTFVFYTFRLITETAIFLLKTKNYFLKKILIHDYKSAKHIIGKHTSFKKQERKEFYICTNF